MHPQGAKSQEKSFKVENDTGSWQNLKFIAVESLLKTGYINDSGIISITFTVIKSKEKVQEVVSNTG